MTIWEEIRHQVAICGKVTDKNSGKGLGQIRVEITNGPAAYLDWLKIQSDIQGSAWKTLSKRPDRVLTAEDGHFHFMDLPDGDYTVNAAFPAATRRYGNASRSATVSHTPGGDIVMAVADVVLPVSTIKGRVLKQGTTTPIVMAEVRIVGGFECTYTDESGDFFLAGVESSPSVNRALIVSARGYQDKTLTISLPAPGDEVVLDFQLVAV